MVIHHEPVYTIYFGDTGDHMYPKQYAQWCNATLFDQPQIRSIAHRLQLSDLTFLSQVHGKAGAIITKQALRTMQPFSRAGDFLITQDAHLGLGIVTADCLPVVCYDKRHNVAGIAHAGWRGAVAGVVPAMIDTMRNQFHTDERYLTVFFGPSAKSCCYRVDDNFTHNFDHCHFAHKALQRREGGLYFDLPGFVCQQLVFYGLNEGQIRMDYNDCTICDCRFYSYRRGTLENNVRAVGRQMTVVVLK